MTPASSVTAVTAAVTALFVPGNRPDRFGKAARAGADLVIIDLEDAVAEGERASALSWTTDAVRADSGTRIDAVVRVVDTGHPAHTEQLESLATVAAVAGHGLVAVMVPKVDDPAALSRITRVFAGVGADIALIGLVESAAGVEAVAELARADGVRRLAFGALDLGLDLGVDSASDVLRVAAAQVVIASRAAGLAAPLDTPSIDIADLDAVAASARHSRDLGFGGKLCIHPAQLDPVRIAFRPSDAEARWADQILAGADDNAARVGGQMVDRPVLERARRIRQLRQR